MGKALRLEILTFHYIRCDFSFFPTPHDASGEFVAFAGDVQRPQSDVARQLER